MAELSHWRLLQRNELPVVEAIAARVHSDLPERGEVLAEKLALCPEGCFALVCEGAMQGYALSHPWRLSDPPALDTFLVALPQDADCLFLHDVALLPHARGRGAVASLMTRLHSVARRSQLSFIACISVYGTAAMWARHGFANSMPLLNPQKLAAYGPSARYMTCGTSVATPASLN